MPAALATCSILALVSSMYLFRSRIGSSIQTCAPIRIRSPFWALSRASWLTLRLRKIQWQVPSRPTSEIFPSSLRSSVNFRLLNSRWFFSSHFKLCDFQACINTMLVAQDEGRIRVMFRVGDALHLPRGGDISLVERGFRTWGLHSSIRPSCNVFYKYNGCMYSRIPRYFSSNISSEVTSLFSSFFRRGESV